MEDQILNSLTIDQAYKQAIKKMRREAINPETFRDIYHEGVDKDNTYVKAMEDKFKQDSTSEKEEVLKLATVFEGIIHENAELSDWLGQNAQTFKTSRFDDIANGVDTIVEFEESETTASHLALAIDVTFSSDTERKLADIRDKIKKGELTKIKYFASEHLGMRGELAKVPRVIIGAESKTIKQLAELWIEGDKKKELGVHPIQFQILEEIVEQLETFQNFAERNHQPELAAIFEKRLAFVSKILEEKRIMLDDNGERDSVFEDIERNLRTMFV